MAQSNKALSALVLLALLAVGARADSSSPSPGLAAQIVNIKVDAFNNAANQVKVAVAEAAAPKIAKATALLGQLSALSSPASPKPPPSSPCPSPGSKLAALIDYKKALVLSAAGSPNGK